MAFHCEQGVAASQSVTAFTAVRNASWDSLRIGQVVMAELLRGVVNGGR